jgi:predicted ATPase/class 3 adenylate cyclase
VATQTPDPTLAFMFTDIEGSTRLWESRPEPMSRALAWHDTVAHRAVVNAGGRVVKGTGDGVYAAFADPCAAVVAAIAIQRELGTADPSGDVAIRVRCGLHAGPAEQRNGDYFGTTINRTARLMAAAHGGQILLSDAMTELVRDRLPDGVALLDLGRVRLKDLARAEHVRQLVHPELPSDFPPLRSLESTPNNLPLQVTAFFGRADEIAEVERLLQRHRLVTITGPGGIGKTRLSLQIAANVLDNFPDGAWFVDLAPLADARLVPRAVAQALGLRVDDETRLVESMCAQIADRRLLIVLDNCEHLIDASARLAASMLAHSPGVTLLATSREHLDAPGEKVFPLAPLAAGDGDPDAALPDAVALFVDRARLKQPDFALTDATRSVARRLCARLDGIPLAIELAAARAGTMPLERMLSRLDDRFRLLAGGSRAALPRQQTLHALIDWSYQLLSIDERALFARLSVFAGGCSAESATAICAGDDLDRDSIGDLLAELARKSLLIASDGGERYRMLETIHEFASQRLGESALSPVFARSHVEHFCALAEAAESHIESAGDQPQWMARLDADLDNLRAALARALVEPGGGTHALRICSSLYRYWAHRGHAHEGRRWCMKALARDPDAAPTPLHARVMQAAGVLAWREADIAAGRALSERALEIARRCGDRALQGRILSNLGGMAVHQSDPAAARRYLEEAIAIERALQHPIYEARCNNNLAALAITQGDYDAAAPPLERALALCREHGLRFEEANAASHLGFLAQRRGDYRSARVLHARAREIAHEFGVREFELEETRQLGAVALGLGELDVARDHLREALSESREIGNRYETAECLDAIAVLAEASGAPAVAIEAASAASALREEIATPRAHAEAHRHDALVTACRRALGDAPLRAAIDRGRARSLETAAAAALAWLGPAPSS